MHLTNPKNQINPVSKSPYSPTYLLSPTATVPYNTNPLMNTKSYILVPALCKWVTSPLPPLLLLSSPAGRRNEVVLHDGGEMLFLGGRSCRAYIGPGSLWTTVGQAATRGQPRIMNPFRLVQYVPCCRQRCTEGQSSINILTNADYRTA